jgi:hypothetical protein
MIRGVARCGVEDYQRFFLLDMLPLAIFVAALRATYS